MKNIIEVATEDSINAWLGLWSPIELVNRYIVVNPVLLVLGNTFSNQVTILPALGMKTKLDN